MLKTIGLPGKGEVDGLHVQEFYYPGGLEQMRRNCRGDVIETYLRFLRARLMRGGIDQGAYRFACEASSHFLANGTALPGVKAPALG